MRVDVVLADAAGAQREALDLPAGATVADALAASRFASRAPAAIGVFGEVATPDRPLRDGDRVDLLSPLLTDPKEARRQRAAAQEAAPRTKPSAAAGG